MYATITGEIIEIGTDHVVVDCSGVGYEIFTNNNGDMKPGNSARFYTHLAVSETAMVLYGFLTKEEKAMFRQLITISGVGPKLALAILSGMNVRELVAAIITADEKALGRISGVGKKTAQRVILELKTKVSGDNAFAAEAAPLAAGSGDVAETIDILIAMQVPPADAAAAVALVKAEGGTSEEMAVRALRTLDRN